MRQQIMGWIVAVALMSMPAQAATAELFPWWAFDSVLEEVQDRGTLRVGLGLFPPWTACNTDGALIGFEIDVATKVAADMGVEVAFVRTNWHYIIPSLLAEEFDVTISGMQILPKRNLKINFTAPYSVHNIYLVANTAQAADRKTLADFNNPSVTIAVRRGTSAIPALKQVFPHARLLLFDTKTAQREALVAGEVHAAAAYGITRTIWVEAHPETLHLPSEEPFTSGVIGMALRTGDLDTLNFLNSWITVNTANGWLEQRRQYWFETREWAGQVATDPDTVAVCEDSFQ